MMQSGKVDLAIVGADRVTKDGYVFNKIGTYQVAVLAKWHVSPSTRGPDLQLRPEADARPGDDRGAPCGRGGEDHGGGG